MKYFLIVLCLLLMGVIYYQYQYYPQLNVEEDAVSETSVLGSESSETSSRLKPIRSYSEIIKRPLFSVDRRPPQIETKSVVASFNAQELDDLILFGVVVSKDTTYAIIGTGQNGETEQIKKGRLYRGWRVEEISSDSVKFAGKDAEYELFLSPNENTKKSGLKERRSVRETISTRETNSAREDKSEKQVIEYKSLFRSSRKKSPITLPNAKPKPVVKKKTQVREPISEADLEALYEEGGYVYEPDAEEEEGFDPFLDDFED